ncbi:hypothetical protein BH09ACT7_BH09ACT7_10630 [soil metagenome]
MCWTAGTAGSPVDGADKIDALERFALAGTRAADAVRTARPAGVPTVEPAAGLTRVLLAGAVDATRGEVLAVLGAAA